MSEGWHVKAAEITTWAKNNSRDAQGTLPLLIRKLIITTVTPAYLRMPAGNSIVYRGWDGVLDCEQGNAFIPQGHSVWEISTEQDAARKIQSDYSKRTISTCANDREKSTIVFVTSTNWSSANWAAQQKAKNEWAEIRVLNTDDLETWLEQSSAVHRWFARLIGKRTEGALDIEQAWGKWISGLNKMQPSNSFVEKAQANRSTSRTPKR